MNDAKRKHEIDRLAELANIGAGQAAGAYAQLVGETIRIDVPEIFDGNAPGRAGDGRTTGDPASSGVFFEFDGCLEAVVGILFPGRSSDRLVRRIVGMEEGELQAEVVESALMEVGNILASHVASAIADTLGSRLLPSIPSLSMQDAEAALEAFVEAAVGGEAPRIISVLRDEAGEVCGRLVLIPRG